MVTLYISLSLSHSPYSGDAGPEELRPLVGACADEEAAVGAALDGQLARARVPLRHQVLRRRSEVVEAVLGTT